MRPTRQALLTLLAGLAALAAEPRPVMAQGQLVTGPDPCAGRVVVIWIQTRQDRPDRFVYSIELQNRSAEQRTFSLSFTGMPADVVLRGGNPLRPNFPLAPGARVQLGFGEGTRTNDLSLATMLVTSDQVFASGLPAVRVHGCVRDAG